MFIILTYISVHTYITYTYTHHYYYCRIIQKLGATLSLPNVGDIQARRRGHSVEENAALDWSDRDSSSVLQVGDGVYVVYIYHALCTVYCIKYSVCVYI